MIPRRTLTQLSLTRDSVHAIGAHLNRHNLLRLLILNILQAWQMFIA